MESQAAAALERQRQMLCNQADAEVTSRDQRIAALEEQNARLLEALKAQPPSSQMAAMTRLAQDTPVDDVSGLTTPRSAANKPSHPAEGSHQQLGLPPSWIGFPPGLGVSSQPAGAKPPQQGELAILLEQVRSLRDQLFIQVHSQVAMPIPPPLSAPPRTQLQGAAGGAPPNPTTGGRGSGEQPPNRQAPPPLWPMRVIQPDGGGGGSDSSDDGDDTSSDEGTSPSSKGQRSAPPECRICGAYHDEINCLYLSGGAANAASTTSKSPVEEEESLVRVKDLKDLTLPGPPNDSGQARGYVN